MTLELQVPLEIDRKVVGVVEAKKEGETLTGVEMKSTDARDPIAASRDLFTFHRPETLAAMLAPPAPDADW